MTYDERLAHNKIYYEQNKDKISLQRKGYYQKNKDKRIAYSKEYYQKNKDKTNAHRKVYYEQNKDTIMAKQKEYERKRQKSDPLYKLAKTCRARIYVYLKLSSIKKTQSTFDMIGCTPIELRDYLQSKFTDGMTLDNHGEWHIDHIIPLASAKTENELVKLCHYTNLQPLWGEDNLSKGVKINLKKV